MAQVNSWFQDIEDVFFRAAVKGYAGNVAKTTLVGLPGSKVITHVEPGFEVTDVYFVNEVSLQSFGSKVIFRNGQPVWFMSYEGRYHKEAIPFLKEVLADSYSLSEFNGGRGRSQKDEELGMEYVNEYKGSFREFHGQEWIRTLKGNPWGTHTYRGRLLTV